LTALLWTTDHFELTVGIRFMKQALLILSVLGMGMAFETIFLYIVT